MTLPALTYLQDGETERLGVGVALPAISNTHLCLRQHLPAPPLLQALGADIAREEKALAELRRKSEGLSKKVEALQAQIEGAGGEKLRRQRALCDKLQEVGGGRVRAGGAVMGGCPGMPTSLYASMLCPS